MSPLPRWLRAFLPAERAPGFRHRAHRHAGPRAHRDPAQGAQPAQRALHRRPLPRRRGRDPHRRLRPPGRGRPHRALRLLRHHGPRAGDDLRVLGGVHGRRRALAVALHLHRRPRPGAARPGDPGPGRAGRAGGPPADRPVRRRGGRVRRLRDRPAPRSREDGRRVALGADAAARPRLRRLLPGVRGRGRARRVRAAGGRRAAVPHRIAGPGRRHPHRLPRPPLDAFEHGPGRWLWFVSHVLAIALFAAAIASLGRGAERPGTLRPAGP